MATPTSEATSIFSLSNELQQAIIEKSGRKGIKSIRLTCRELSAAADHVFIRKFFIIREHLLTSHSLRALVEISKTPRLCNKIQAIKFNHMHPDQYTLRPSRYISPRSKVLFKERWATIFNDTKENAIDLIKELLKNFKAASHFPSIGIDTPARAFHKPDSEKICYGLVRLKSELDTVAGCDNIELEQQAYSGSTELEVYWLLSSLLTANFPVRSLHLCLEEPEPFGRGAFDFDHQSSLRLEECFSNLESLALKLDTSRDWPSTRIYQTLHEVLPRSGLLKHVSLGSLWQEGSWQGGPDLHDDLMLGSVISNAANLESLTLHDCQVSQTKLHEILHRCRRALKKLHLTQLAIAPGVKWKKTFLWIAENCKELEQFAPCALFQGSEKLTNGVEITGKASMEEQIMDFAENAVFSEEDISVE